MKRDIRIFAVFAFLLCMFCHVLTSYAGDSLVAPQADALSKGERLSLARSFVSKIKKSLNEYEQEVRAVTGDADLNILPDGEVLLLQVVIDRRFRPEGAVMARAQGGRILVSLRDFADTLQLAITVNDDGSGASGWYLRENRLFELNAAARQVKTAKGSFTVSGDVIFEDGDIFVPSAELAQWLGMEFDLGVSAQEIKVKTDVLLPAYAKFLRENKTIRDHRIPEASLPLGGRDYRNASVPIIDVSTNSTYSKRNTQDDGVKNHTATIRTSSDFAQGNLATQTRINNRDQVASVLATYRQDSVDGDLLGPLEAKRFEVGDILTTLTPFGGNSQQELGVRVTNTDTLTGFNRLSTVISGNAIPGWDVELYRGNQLLGIQVVDDNGFYQFQDVDLFQNENIFRVVFYGLQGEIQEEIVSVPVDRDLQGRSEGIYDVSVSLNERNTYEDRRFESSNDNKGSVNVSALYERPIASGVTGTVGFRSEEDGNEDRNSVASVGLSTNVLETLLNASVAVDDAGGAAALLAARRNLAEHEFASSLSWDSGSSGALGGPLGSGFSSLGLNSGGLTNSNGGDNYSASLRVNGPVLDTYLARVRYNLDTQHDFNQEGDSRTLSSASLNSSARGITLNTGFFHENSSDLDEDRLNSFTTLSGSYGRNRLRFNTNYEVSPDSHLESVVASYNRRINNNLDADLEVSRRPEEKMTEYQARLDWQAGFIRISPSVRYNSEQDFFAGLSTRFGVLQEPITDKLKFYDRNVTNFGLVSAFVYLDKDGDGVFNGEDEPLEGVTVLAPQNSRQEKTDKDGIALFSRMIELRLTDVFVSKETLQDPSWIPGFEGVSILPREGYVAQVEFPIHIAGEMDGTVYAKVSPLPEDRLGENYVVPAPVPLRNIDLVLYNDKGEVEQSVTTDSGGFYYFSNIPPGRYFLMIDGESAHSRKIIRPEPHPVEIGYEGTVIFGHDIHVDTGRDDVPAEILSDLNDYKDLHSNLDFNPDDHDVVLNLGEFNSSLLMSVVWYKLRSRYGSILSGSDLFVPPTESYADVKTGKHVLRVGLGGGHLGDAYKRCRALMARDQYCKVEIYPAALKQAKADVIETEIGDEP